MIGEPNDLTGYKALCAFKNESNSINLDRGDVITAEEYESLHFSEQEAFVPVYKTK